MLMRRICLSLGLISLCVLTARAQQDQALQTRLSALAAAHHGKVALFAEDLTAVTSGSSIGPRSQVGVWIW